MDIPSPTPVGIISRSRCSYEPFTDSSFDSCLLAYCLAKYFAYIRSKGARSSARSIVFPLLSGFFATYLTTHRRPTHSILFCTPLKESPNDIATTETCLCDMKTAILKSRYQEEAVLVVDEKLYQNCLKVCISSFV